ncbi:MAG: hypothetical protein JWP30_137 [Homoserinimonas sp.]|jgi:hypothetical protein|nr:hypothetical protein [Mycetocola sp.]MCU1545037.1 hypothetical protein [Homoserinimonas sp.]
MTVLTPTVRTWVRTSLFWIFAIAVALLIAVAVMVTRGAAGSGGAPLSPTNAGPVGSMAVAEVLRDQGVTVVVAATITDALKALARSDEATLLLHDSGQFLARNQLTEVTAAATHTVLVEPGFTQLRALAPVVKSAGQVSGVLQADCNVPAVVNAGTVTGGGSGYRVDDGTEGFAACLGSGDERVSLVQFAQDGRTMSVVGTVDALSNEHIAANGNAAFALTLLGATDTLVWYQPTTADLHAENAPTVGELTPDWVSSVIALLLLVFVAAAVWRGRRMGPLIIENLPVTVPASETLEGRARLYQQASARLRALDALRIGSLERIARMSGLASTATVDEVVLAAAALTGRDAGMVKDLLVDAIPVSDRDLIRLSDQLLEFERAAAHATRPA